MYQLNPTTITAMAHAFESASVIKECSIPNTPTLTGTRHQLFIRFSSPIELSLAGENVKNIINQLLEGDKALTTHCETTPSQLMSITAALRWVASDTHPSLLIKGLGLTVNLKNGASTSTFEDALLNALMHINLITTDHLAYLRHHLSHALQTPPTFHHGKHFGLFAANHADIANQKKTRALHASGQHYIKTNITPIYKADKKYDGENAINPAFENIAQVKKTLRLNEKRIWLLRSDFILALGVKNAYQDMWGYQGLLDTFDECNYPHIEWQDRAGHPSLAFPDDTYDGSVYYAGHFAQRDGYLEVLNYSGRFDRHDLTEEQLKKLEAYVSLQFQKAFGEQKIVFITNARNTNADYYELSLFYTDSTLQKLAIPKREYTLETIASILSPKSAIKNEAHYPPRMISHL
jgi:hypothetical protein